MALTQLFVECHDREPEPTALHEARRFAVRHVRAQCVQPTQFGAGEGRGARMAEVVAVDETRAVVRVMPGPTRNWVNA